MAIRNITFKGGKAKFWWRQLHPHTLLLHLNFSQKNIDFIIINHFNGQFKVYSVGFLTNCKILNSLKILCFFEFVLHSSLNISNDKIYNFGKLYLDYLSVYLKGSLFSCIVPCELGNPLKYLRQLICTTCYFNQGIWYKNIAYEET